MSYNLRNASDSVNTSGYSLVANMFCDSSGRYQGISTGDIEVHKYWKPGPQVVYKKITYPLYFQTYDTDLSQYNIWTSTDESNWTLLGTSPEGFEQCIYFKGYYYLSNYSGNVKRTSDFISFSANLDGSNIAGSALAFFTDGNILFRYSDSLITPRYTTDGVNWSAVTNLTTSTGITKLGSSFIAWDSSTQTLKTSTDGITFNAGYTPDATLTPNTFSGITFTQTCNISGEERTYMHLLDGGIYLVTGYITTAPTANDWTLTSANSFESAEAPFNYRWQVGNNQMLISYIMVGGHCTDQDDISLLNVGASIAVIPWYDRSKKKLYCTYNDGFSQLMYSLSPATDVSSDFSEITYIGTGVERVFTR